MQCSKAVIPAMDVDEFINIKRQDPFCLLHHLQFGSGFQRGELNATFLIGAVVADVGNATKRLQPIEHHIRAIVAIVGKDEHMVEADGTVMRQPFQQECTLVADTKDREVRDLTIHGGRPRLCYANHGGNRPCRPA